MNNPGVLLERPPQAPNQDPIAHLDFEPQPLLPGERYLTEVDNLNRHRLEDGTHAPQVLDEIFKNLVPYVKEGGIPNAVHRVEHPYRETAKRDEAGRNTKAYMWLGRTAVQNAESGYAFHKSPAALERVAVEVNEARDTEANLRPGVTKVFISPRMSRDDASYEDAKAEHLADDDAIRLSQAVTDEQGNIQQRAMESLLVRDIPLAAWVAMLADPNNKFGKSIAVENPDSALSVMKVHPELEVPDDSLPEGVISIVEAVVPYIEDEAQKASAEQQLERFREDQEDMQTKAVNIAKRWRDFEIELADSLDRGLATPAICEFIASMQTKWNEDDLATITSLQGQGVEFKMTRELAVIVERAKQKLLLSRASVVTGNKRITDQMEDVVVEQIYDDEMTIQAAYDNNRQVTFLEANSNRIIAGQNLKGIGGGCAGDNDTEFNSDGDKVDALGNKINSGKTSSEKKVGKISRGRCVVKTCPTSPNEVKVGGCGVCLDRCQKLFDQGKDPTKMGTVTRAAGKNTIKATVDFVTRPTEKLAGTSIIKKL